MVGSLNMDLVFRTPRFPVPGETLIGQSFTIVNGGKGANQAVACARLGAQVALVGRVGADDFGQKLTAALAQDGIDTRRVSEDTDAPSGTALIMVDATGQNCIVVTPGANGKLATADLDRAEPLLRTAALMIIQLEVPLATVSHALTLARRAGCPVLLNPAPMQPIPDTDWSGIDYLIPNETEASALTGIEVIDLDSARSAARALRHRGVKTVLITLGANGVLIEGPDGSRHLPARPVKAVDTTAAGDTFIGGFAAGLLEGMSLDDAVQLGQRAAALCVTRCGAQSSIPYRKEL